MNNTGLSSKNILLVRCCKQVDTKYIDELFKMVYEKAGEAKITIWIRPKPLQHFPGNIEPNKEMLNRIIFIYGSDIQTIIFKLQELHVWTMRPRFIILDSIQDFKSSEDENTSLQQYVLLISTLFNCTPSLEARLKMPCMSLTISNEKFNCLQQLVDLYFYKSTISDVQELKLDI